MLQLKGRILAGLGKKDESLLFLEEAKDIREALKGKTHFTTGQVYSYLMDVYDQFEEYGKALRYAIKYYDILSVQYKTQDIITKLADVEGKIAFYKEKSIDE